MIGLDVTDSFQRLPLQKIELAIVHLQAGLRVSGAAIKKEDRARREEVREAARALKEMEAARAKQQKTDGHHLTLLARLDKAGNTDGVDWAPEQLAEAQAAQADVDNRQATTRAANVCVISNVGSFGERMVKVGMTRQLDPMDRVKELGGDGSYGREWCTMASSSASIRPMSGPGRRFGRRCPQRPLCSNTCLRMKMACGPSTPARCCVSTPKR